MEKEVIFGTEEGMRKGGGMEVNNSKRRKERRKR